MEEKWRSQGKEAIQSSSHAKEFKYHVFLITFGCDDSFHYILRDTLNKAGFSVAEGSTSNFSPMEAIEQSKLCIPIFSSSLYFSPEKCCLDELAKMNECRRKRSGQIVLPIFYYIEPSDVQNQSGPYERPFRRFQESGISKKYIERLTEALRAIGSLKGCTVDSYKSGRDAAKEIVDQVINVLVNEASLDNNLVGIEQSCRSIVEMLYNTSNDRMVGGIRVQVRVREVGICGMPGVGKTTLAWALYNSLHGFYEGCCFVSSIQERSKKEGLYSLQVQLIKELINMDYHLDFGSFKDYLKARFSNARVLFVLDGVECLDHIKAFGVGLGCFGHGSRIILTTRKPELLVEARVRDRYFLEELDELQALKLFCKHTFQKDTPEEEYRDLSAEIASSTRGIPSVIKSVGSYLSNYRNKEKERWEEVLQQLRSCQYEPLEELLRLSHDFLSKGRWHFYHDKKYLPIRETNVIAHYDVVLSFDARDKVKNLVESLHKRMESYGIVIFAVNGDYVEVNDTVFIPVLSKSYASNSSCFEMLAHMVKYSRLTARIHILPIFCAIEPSSDDRLQTLLKESCSGCSLSETFTTKEFQNLIDSVCQMTLDKLQLNRVMKNHLVGINKHVDGIWKLLNPEVNDVRSIVIRGEDGTGKTTLAKFVYHQLSSSFEGCSFLAEIDERTQHRDGIKHMQAKLMSDLLNTECEVFTSVTEGINLIKERFQRMKVLIILDDVTKCSHVEDLVGQMNWFGQGSRIIITASVNTKIPLPHSNYSDLNTWYSHLDEASELFRMHAFRRGDRQHIRLSAIDIAKLLRFHHPILALKVVGSLLYGKDCKKLHKKLKNVGDSDLRKILKMSYGRLNEKQKQIFLDISCFPIGLDRRIASYLWCHSLRSPGSTGDDLEALILLSLVKVDANNEIWMHRVVRNFGRKIVDQERSRWQGKRRGKTKTNLRFFKLDHTNITGSTNCALMKERGIIWEWRSLDLLATFRLEDLKVLDMSWTKVTEDWQGWSQIKVPELRVLNLTGCSDLILTPAFSFCPKLEMLILEQCSRLVKIDPSIGNLKCLTTLNLRYCLELCVLPKEVGHLTALRELPLDGTSLREIPVLIGCLRSLHVLTAIDCLSLSHLPSSTCDLRFVTVMKLDRANITELPYLIGKMKLQHLSLRGCQGIKTLESLVGEVENSLVELDVSKTSISELPKSVIKLKALRVLKMDFCFIIEFPQCFGELKKLEEIHASWCRSLENLPNDIGELKRLRILKVGHSCISTLPRSIIELVGLQTLDCTSCNNLQNLPKLPSGLTYLHVESKELKELPDFAHLRCLKEFTLVNGDIPDVSVAVTAGKDDPFHWLELSSGLRMLELCLSNIKTLPDFPVSLRKLSLRCASLEHIPSIPASLVSLSIKDCTSLNKMPCVEYAEALEEMEILRCPEIEEIEGLGKLNALKVLSISNSGVVSLDGLNKLTSLTRLTLSDCPAKQIEGLEKLQALVVLTISSSKIVSLTGLFELASLKNLTLSDCPEIKQVEGFTKLEALEVLTISSCWIESLTELGKLASLKKLTLLDCDSLSKFPDLSALEGVDVVMVEKSH